MNPVSQSNQATPEPSAEATDDREVFYQLDPGYIPVQRISGLIFAGVVSAVALVGLGIKLLIGGFDWVFGILGAAAVVLCILLFVLAIVWPPISYRHIFWRLTSLRFEIRRGVIWRHQISIPTARVQHADVSQGPLQRSYQLGTLTIHTAGTQNASVEIDGLNHATAVQLRDEIIRQRKATDVV